MRKTAMIALSVMILLASTARMGGDERNLTVAVFVIGLLLVVLLYRRFKRSAAEAPDAYSAAAAIALTLGIVTAIGGVGHSVAVTSVALSDRAYGPLTILRFTTGAMLLYSGVM